MLHQTHRLQLIGLTLAFTSAACSVQDLGVPAPPLSTACNAGGLEVYTRAFPACDPGVCASEAALGYCVSPALVDAASQSRLAHCNDGSLCVPKAQLINNGRFTPKTCRSVANLEGRCLSQCLPEISSQGDSLPQADCDAGERCAPCYDPRTGEDSGACSSSDCDSPKEGKSDFCAIDYNKYPLVDLKPLELCPAAICSYGTAHCADNGLIAADQLDSLASCDDKRKCVPDVLLVSGGNQVPRTCTAGGGLEGRCQSLCIGKIADQSDLLQQDVCSVGELCAPCFDPRTSEPTGACTAGACDKPKTTVQDLCSLDYASKPLVDVSKLDRCPGSVCTSSAAHCFKNSNIGADQLDRLADCDADRKCVPDLSLKSGGNTPGASCRAWGKAEGRCQSTCLPEIASQKDSLPVEMCAADELCAPCFNPVTGLTTGSCDQTCDKAVEPAFLFAECCDGHALCVPEGTVSASQRGSLDNCPTDPASPSVTFKCAPREYAEAGAKGTTYVAPTCSDPTGKPGACISTCISSANTVGAVDTECPANSKCVPCKITIPILSILIGDIATGACN